MNRLTRQACVGIIFLMTVCLTPAIASVKHTAPKNLALSSWELSGAIAAKNRRKGWTATLNWLQQGPNQYQIRLFGPLGGGAIIIEKRGAVITLRDGSKRRTSGNADELLKKETGVRLPVKNLYYWVRGLPAPGFVQSAQRGENNHLRSFNQAGYTIDYTEYASVNGMMLPSKIRLQGQGVLIKLVIKHWRV